MEFLAPSIAGDLVACLGVSEAGSGSDVASIQTTALPKKGEVSGELWWLTFVYSEVFRRALMVDLCVLCLITNCFTQLPRVNIFNSFSTPTKIFPES